MTREVPAEGAPRLVGCRVDWLQVAYGVTLSTACAQALVDAQLLADMAGRAEFREAGIPFELRRNATFKRIAFSNADVGGMFDSAAPEGWSLGPRRPSALLGDARDRRRCRALPPNRPRIWQRGKRTSSTL